jgi:hypothetical protein
MLQGFVTAELLARRHALGGVAVVHARQRLSGVASILGDGKMRYLLAQIPDPTDPRADPTDPRADPDWRRGVRYVAGMWRPGW